MEKTALQIRETKVYEKNMIADIHRKAFGQDAEAELVLKLLNDSTAEPKLSLVALDNELPVGHILFTKIHFEEDESFLMHILCPLAVLPDAQGKGAGKKLIQKGIKMLREQGSELIFVLGYESYYTSFGFIPNAGAEGLEAPFPIPAEHSGAWMYLPLNNEIPKRGKLRSCLELNKAEYWAEG